jgi:hypothetical protein
MSIRHDLFEIILLKKRQCWMLLGYITILLTGAYLFSPYWAAHKLLSAFEEQDILKIKALIPEQFTIHLIPKTHSAMYWQGAGRKYLQHIEPKLYSEIDPIAWLAVQAQLQGNNDTHHYYAHYFNQYQLDLGSNQDHQQLRIVFTRTDLMHWHVTRVCYPNPQPDWVVNRCPSSNR